MATVSQELVDRCDNLSVSGEIGLKGRLCSKRESAFVWLMSATTSCGHAAHRGYGREVPGPDQVHRSKDRAYGAAFPTSTILGSRTVKVEPRTGSLSTVMSPPIIWQNRLLIASPSPVPPYLRVVDASACENS
jgi:hypothetical protein